MKLFSLALTLSSSITIGFARTVKRQAPANATGVQTITAPSGAQIRFKQPGAEGICETTPGVNSYAGYVDLDSETHMFFWFFEARHQPAEAPLTLWYVNALRRAPSIYDCKLGLEGILKRM